MLASVKIVQPVLKIVGNVVEMVNAKKSSTKIVSTAKKIVENAVGMEFVIIHLKQRPVAQKIALVVETVSARTPRTVTPAV